MTHETPKIPLDLPKFSPMTKADAQLMALHNAAVGGNTGATKSRATTIKSGSSGYDGKSDPGSPGEPV